MLVNVKKELTSFSKLVIKQSRQNLTKQKHNYTKQLYDSLSYQIKESKNSFLLKFEMDKHGDFQDKGVSGTQKKYDTPYSYKASSNLVGLELATGIFAKWAKAKNFRFRTALGRFAEGNYKQIGIVLAKSIKKKGIKPTNFFTRPFRQNFEKLPKELVDAYALDVQDLLNYTRKK